MWRYFDIITYVLYYHGAGREAQGKPLQAEEGKGNSAAAAILDGKALPSISLLEFRVFIRKAALTSPYLNLAQLEILVPSIDGARKASHTLLHHPEGRVNLAEFMEGLVRSSINRQENPANPAKTLPQVTHKQSNPPHHLPTSSTPLF